MMYWGNGMNGWGVLLMTLSTLVFWGLIVAGVVFLVRHFSPSGGGAARQAEPVHHPADPVRILAERYARGEIGDEEFQRRLTVLRGGPPPGTPPPGAPPA